MWGALPGAWVAWHPNKKILRHYPWQNSGARRYHQRSSVLSMAFRWDIPQYTLESLQRRPADNDPSPASETLWAIDSNKPYYNVL